MNLANNQHPGIIRVQKLKDQRVIAEKCHVAESFGKRFIGLMGKAGLTTGEGLWIRPCNSIHMWFMRFSIDAVFLAKNKSSQKNQDTWVVTSTRNDLPAWKVLPVMDLKAESVLELPAGSVQRLSIRVGDELCIS